MANTCIMIHFFLELLSSSDKFLFQLHEQQNYLQQDELVREKQINMFNFTVFQPEW